MWCLSCQYDLRNLSEHRCPECGREFDPNDPSTYYEPPARGLSNRTALRIAGVCYALNVAVLFYFAIKHDSSFFRVYGTSAVPVVALFLLPVTFVVGLMAYGVFWIVRRLTDKT